MHDPISNMLTALRNGQAANLIKIYTLNSSLKIKILECIKNLGYIKSFKLIDNRIEISLIYMPDGSSVIRDIQAISTPGRRSYIKASKLKPYRNGLGVKILYTNIGVIDDSVARKRNVGGELCCKIF